jgi:hypothetical protein
MAMDGRFEQLTAEFQATLRRTAELKVELDMAAGLYPPGTVPHYNLIEDAAQEVAAEVSRLTQQLHLRNLHAEHLRAAPCPGCGGRCEVRTEPRPVTTLAGPVELDDLVAHCPVCRRDFFPPASDIGVRRPRAHAAGRAADHGRRR